MTDDIKYEKPNAVSCLMAKHDELSKLKAKYQAEIRKLDVDINHIRAAIRVFDPNSETYEMAAMVAKPRAQRGHVKQFILSTLRTSEAPMTSRQIAEKWADAYDLPKDRTSMTRLRSRLASSLKDYTKQGLVECAGSTIDHDQWGPYKLWRIKC